MASDSTASFPPEPIQHPPEGAAAKKSDQKRRQNEEIQATDDHSTRKTKRAKLKTYSIKTKASPKKELKVGTWTVGKPESGDMRTLSVYAYLDRRRYIHLRCCDSDKSKLGFEWDGSPKWETILLNPDLSSVPLQEAKDRIKNRLKNGDGEAEVTKESDDDSVAEGPVDKESIAQEQVANQQVEEDVHDYPAAGELIEKISLVEGVGHALIKELKKGFAVRDDKIKEQEQELEGLRRREREAGETGNARSISPKKPEWELEPLEQSEDLENLEKSGRSGTEITQPGSGIKDARLEP